MGGRNRQRATIDRRPSGSLQVSVYAGIDPTVTKKRHERPRAADARQKLRDPS